MTRSCGLQSLKYLLSGALQQSLPTSALKETKVQEIDWELT